VNDQIAKDIFKRIGHVLPITYADESSDGTLDSVSHRIRYLRYTGGGELTRHEDVYSVMDDAGYLKTNFSLMIYLNDNFEGGATALWESEEADSKQFDVEPREGSVFIFDHRILHSGERVNNGRKYVCRTDVTYRFKESKAIAYSTRKANGT